MLHTEAGLVVASSLHLCHMATVSHTHKKLGEKIKILRKKAQLTQEDLAFQVGVDRSYMGFLERGERNPTLTTMIKISQVFKIPVKELLS